MDIPLHAEVRCTDGAGGKTQQVVLNPVRRMVTHVVVRTEGFLGQRVMMPVDVITESAPDHVTVRLSRAELGQLPPYVETDYVVPPAFEGELSGPFAYGYTGGGMVMTPYIPSTLALTETKESLPDGELSLRRGDEVEATDGRVGRVDELLVDPKSYTISHLVLREGHLWGARDVVIPVAQIASIEEGIVRLKLSKREVEEQTPQPAG
jgi:sporulation protein YlmC with PRC-barrel domain